MPFENRVADRVETCDPKQWVDRYADYLFKYAIARLNDEEIAKDLVQETFFSALKGLDKFAGKSSEKTWLTSILKHKIIDIYRKDYVRNTNLIAEDEYFNAEDGHWKTNRAPQLLGIEQQDPLNNKEFNQTLQLCFKKLPALWATVFTMKHVDDEPTETILLSMNISSSNFWVIIHRTKLSLRACLQSNWL